MIYDDVIIEIDSIPIKQFDQFIVSDQIVEDEESSIVIDDPIVGSIPISAYILFNKSINDITNIRIYRDSNKVKKDFVIGIGNRDYNSIKEYELK